MGFHEAVILHYSFTQYVSPNRWRLRIILHGVTLQETVILTLLSEPQISEP